VRRQKFGDLHPRFFFAVRLAADLDLVLFLVADFLPAIVERPRADFFFPPKA
jgi:hypothetical protein